ncbi:MAG: phosphate ABC transporter substrate-binding protein PstS [Planctomycetota bacterium]
MMIHRSNTVRMFLTMMVAAVALAGIACPPAGKGNENSSSGTSTNTKLNYDGPAVKLIGSGATFPAPLYLQWFTDLSNANKNIEIEYQSVGSGTGIKNFTAGTCDFGASDAAMSDDEIAKVKGGVIMLPMTAGSIVLAFNIPGVKELKLSREAYVGIFLNKITKWNDPKIASTNPGITLPDADINTVHRSDSSGTTFGFTNHLNDASAEWKAGPGVGKAVNWPSGVGAGGNEGVSTTIMQTANSIGYVEYGYAKQLEMPMASLQNKNGKYATASLDSAAKTLSAVVLPENLRAFITDPEGDASYPIVSYTWLLCHPVYDDENKCKALKALIDYCLHDGQKMSSQLGYVPLPADVVAKVKAAADKITWKK